MNIDDEAEVDLILVKAYILVPDSSPKLLGAIGLQRFTLYAQRGWHPERGGTAKSGLKETLARGPLCVFHMAVKRCHI